MQIAYICYWIDFWEITDLTWCRKHTVYLTPLFSLFSYSQVRRSSIVTYSTLSKRRKKLICEPFIFLNYTCMRKTNLSFIYYQWRILEKTLRFLDLLSSTGVCGSRSVLERTGSELSQLCILLSIRWWWFFFFIMSWSLLIAFLW